MSFRQLHFNKPLFAEIDVNAMICRNCGAGLEADKIDHSLMIITCSHCGSMHGMPNTDLRESLGDATTTVSESSPLTLEREQVALPDRFKIHQTAGGMEITWPVGGVYHGLVLLIIAAGFAYIAMTQGMYFLIVASVGLIYFAAVRTFNEHRIRTDSSSLQVTQGPLPWPGARELNVADIEQLFSIEYESRQEKGSDGDSRIELTKHYQLTASTRNNKRIKLLRGLNDPLQALWLEQEIERSLDIRNKRVAGEHSVPI